MLYILNGGAESPKISIIQRFSIPVRGDARAHHAIAPKNDERKKAEIKAKYYKKLEEIKGKAFHEV